MAQPTRLRHYLLQFSLRTSGIVEWLAVTIASVNLHDGLFQILGRLINSRRCILDYLRHLWNLRLGLFPPLLVHILADRGNRLSLRSRCRRLEHRSGS